MGFTYRETQTVKGMLARGDKQHDIASYFGVNGGRVAEVASGNCDYPNALALEEAKLPPAGPYVGAKTVHEIVESLREAEELIRAAGNETEEAAIAIEALNECAKKIGD